MVEKNTVPVVIFGKLGGFALLMIGFSSLIAASGLFLQVVNTKPSEQITSVSSETVKDDFQLIQMGEMRRDQYLVNKSNGRIWQKTCLGENLGPDCKGILSWDEMYVDGVTPDNSVATTSYFQEINKVINQNNQKRLNDPVEQKPK